MTVIGNCQHPAANPDDWHPDGGTVEKRTADAKRLCAECPLTSPCLEFILDFEGGNTLNTRHGYWAGTIPEHRANLTDARHAGYERRSAHEPQR